MTHQLQNNQLEKVLGQVNEHGLEGIQSVLVTLLNIAMRIEREQHLCAAPLNEQSSDRDMPMVFKSKLLSMTRSPDCRFSTFLNIGSSYRA